MLSLRITCVFAVIFLTACQTSQAPETEPVSNDVLSSLQNVKGSDGVAALEKIGFARATPDVLEDLVNDNTLKTGSTYAYYKWDKKVYIRDTALGARSRGTWNIQDGNVCLQVGKGAPFCTAVFLREQVFLCWPNFGEFMDETGFARACELFDGNAIPVPN